MEKGDARLFRTESKTNDHGWNVVELESHRQMRRKIHELIRLSASNTGTTSEVQQWLRRCVETFSARFTIHLARSLQRESQAERQSIVWLLTVLNDKEAIPTLQQISLNEKLSRVVRLSAALALAGMGATQEMLAERNEQLYAIS